MAPPAKAGGTSLSALQAQMRKGKAASTKAGAPKAAAEGGKAGTPAAAGSPGAASQKRSAPDDGKDVPPAKMAAITKQQGSAKPSITKAKAPAVAKVAKVAGAAAKADAKGKPAAAPPKAGIAKVQPMQTKVGLSVKTAAAAPPTASPATDVQGPPPPANGAVPSPAEAMGAASAKSLVGKKTGSLPPPSLRQQAPSPPPLPQASSQEPASQEGSIAPASGMADEQAVVASLMAALDGPLKMSLLMKLSEALGRGLAIEHLNHFLKGLKVQLVDRAHQDGVRVPTTADFAATAAKKSTPAKPSAPAGASSTAKAPAVAAAPPPKAASAPAAPAAPAAAPAEASPIGSPPAEQGEADDTVYKIIGTIADDPVVVDGSIQEVRLLEVLKRVFDATSRPKDWQAVWHAMSIPVERQAEVLSKFFDMALVQEADHERAPIIVGDLVKNHRVKMRSVEEVLSTPDALLMLSDDAWQVYANFLVHIYPKPQNAGWGWSRVGWSWQMWWQFADRCIQSLDESRAFDIICMIMRLIEEREGQPLTEVTSWTTDRRLQKTLQRLATLRGCEAGGLLEKLAEVGVTTTGMEEPAAAE